MSDQTVSRKRRGLLSRAVRRMWALARSGVGGLYVLIGVTSFFGYSELTHIRTAIDNLTPDVNGAIPQILDVANDPDADSVARASSRAFSLHINGQKDAALELMHAILAVLEGLPNSEERRSRAWHGIGFFHHQDIGAGGALIVSRDAEANDQAREAYSNAIDLDSDAVASYVNRGIAHDVLGRYEDAERDYSIAIELQPDERRAYFHRGDLYLRRSRENDARTDLEEALSLARDAGDNALITQITRLLERLGR